MNDQSENTLIQAFLKSREGKRIFMFILLLLVIVGAGLVMNMNHFYSSDSTAKQTDRNTSPLKKNVDRIRKADITQKQYKQIQEWQQILRPVKDGNKLSYEDEWYYKLLTSIHSIDKKVLYDMAIRTLNPRILMESSTWFRGRVININGIFLEGQQVPVVRTDSELDQVWEVWLRDTKHHVTVLLHLTEKPSFSLEERNTHISTDAVFAKWIPYELKNPPSRNPDQQYSKAIFLVGKNINKKEMTKTNRESGTFSSLNILFLFLGLASILGVTATIYFTGWKDEEVKRKLQK